MNSITVGYQEVGEDFLSLSEEERIKRDHVNSLKALSPEERAVVLEIATDLFGFEKAMDFFEREGLFI